MRLYFFCHKLMVLSTHVMLPTDCAHGPHGRLYTLMNDASTARRTTPDRLVLLREIRRLAYLFFFFFSIPLY